MLHLNLQVNLCIFDHGFFFWYFHYFVAVVLFFSSLFIIVTQHANNLEDAKYL